MPRVCTVCSHAERATIDAAIIAGGTLRDIARRFGVSKDAVSRHAGDHVPAKLAKAQEASEVAQADDLLSQVRRLQAKTLRILSVAEADGDLRTALMAIRESRDNLLLFARLEALKTAPQTVIHEVYPSAWVDAFAALDGVDPFAKKPEEETREETHKEIANTEDDLWNIA